MEKQPGLHGHFLQVQLYEDFAKSRAKAGVEDSISMASTEEEEKPKLKATGHVFQVQIELSPKPSDISNRVPSSIKILQSECFCEVDALTLRVRH